MVWKPLNELHFHRDMHIFDYGGNTKDYDPVMAFKDLPQRNLESLMRKHLGVDRPRGQKMTQKVVHSLNEFLIALVGVGIDTEQSRPEPDADCLQDCNAAGVCSDRGHSAHFRV